MGILSPEVNRFLGFALLDPTLLKCFFSSERSRALQGFKLQPAERSTILASQARTLSELSRELTTQCVLQDRVAETDATIDQFYKSVHTNEKRTSIRMDMVAQRIINTLPAQPVVDAATGSDRYLDVLAAS